MNIVEKVTEGEHERVLFANDPATGYRGIIAIHSTKLGPAVGGTRFWNYQTDEAALADALRLSRGMTYKNALAGLPLGGGKSVIVGDSKTADRETIFRLHGQFVESLGGSYITAEDVGTSPEDMEIMRQETRHVGGLLGASGDPSPITARGVFRAIQASAKYVWGTDDLMGKRVAIQGCGHVGYHVAKELHSSGACLIVCDVDPERVSRAVADFNAKAVPLDEIYGVDADIFSPCALGGILNNETIPQLQVYIVAGGANNQLAEQRHGEMLRDLGILYAPDYAANAGGILNGCIEMLGWSVADARRRVDEIYDTVTNIFELARAQRIPTNQAADQLAEQRLSAVYEPVSSPALIAL